MLGLLVGPQVILDEPQVVTTDWEDLGAEIDCRAMANIALWLKVNIEDSQDLRVRMLVLFESGHDDRYVLPLRTNKSTVVEVRHEIKQLAVNEDQNIPLSWTLDHMVPYAQFQVQAGALGSAAGQVVEARVTAGY